MTGITEEDRKKMGAMYKALQSGKRATHAVKDEEVAQPRLNEDTCRMIQESDASAYELADALPYSRNTIRKHKQGNCQHTSTPIDERRCAVAREMHKDGITMTEISERFDTTPDTVRHHVRGHCTCTHEVSPSFHNTITAEECQELRADFDAGRQIHELLDKYNVSSKATIYRHAKGRCHHTDRQ